MPSSALFKGFSSYEFSQTNKEKNVQSAINAGVLFTNQYRQKNHYIIQLATTALNNGASVAIVLASGAVYFKLNNEFTEKLLNSSCNGTIYNCHYNDLFLNIKKNHSISSVSLRQVCYVPIDMAVSEGLDKVAELASVKIFTDNISAEKKNFLKKHLTITTSAVAIDMLERSMRKDYSSAYDKPIETLILNHVLTEGLIEYLSVGLETQTVMRFVMREYVTPHIVQTVRGMFG
jgi:hypothetical protein